MAMMVMMAVMMVVMAMIDGDDGGDEGGGSGGGDCVCERAVCGRSQSAGEGPGDWGEHQGT